MSREILKLVPVLIIFQPDLGTLKGRTVISRKWFIKSSQRILTVLFPCSLFLECQEEGGFYVLGKQMKGSVFLKKQVIRRRKETNSYSVLGYSVFL